MVFNAQKCKVMHLRKNNNEFEYQMGEIKLETTECEKGLGVWVDDDLKLMPISKPSKPTEFSDSFADHLPPSMHHISTSCINH